MPNILFSIPFIIMSSSKILSSTRFQSIMYNGKIHTFFVTRFTPVFVRFDFSTPLQKHHLCSCFLVLSFLFRGVMLCQCRDDSLRPGFLLYLFFEFAEMHLNRFINFCNLPCSPSKYRKCRDILLQCGEPT